MIFQLLCGNQRLRIYLNEGGLINLPYTYCGTGSVNLTTLTTTVRVTFTRNAAAPPGRFYCAAKAVN